MRRLVVIPTYNEAGNIQTLVPEVLDTYEGLDVLVVDDNSPDGTAEVVKSSVHFDKRVFLLSRPGKQGLGKAYLAGFAWALARGYEQIIEMDADFSHSVVDLGKILDGLSSQPFVVGSRYTEGGSTANWGILRKLISRGGSIYARTILGFPLRDWTGGFNGWQSETLKSIDLSQVKSEGYCFQIELKYRALLKNHIGLEVPICFEDRRVGQSKMSLKIVLEAFYRVWLLRFQIPR